ncbi:MAG: 4Fe-4S dicluster domain-containing protein [Sulfurisoma sp.]|nr:4Fe-4S dicluster domain-containing protein [Sulfurisoma sp.]
MEALLDKNRLKDWIAALDGWEAYAPARQDGIWSYQPAGDNPELNHPNTPQPPKGFAFPQREIFFKFEQVKGEAPRLTAVSPAPTFRVVFGVRPCDGRAVPRMDRVFSDHVDDGYYQARRDGLAYVGLACNTPPSRHCFCQSVGGSPVSTDGLDVLLTDLGERYFVAAVTDTGKALMQAAGALLAKPGAAERKEVARLHAAAVAQPQRGVNDAAAAPAKLKAGFDSPLWEELARACIGCGICTFLCPTCHCFDINDEVTGTVPLKGSRVRTWDSCQFPDFTMHSSGHNPRDTLGSRLRQRVSHKFRYFHENFGMHQCTGCGRCVSECPVGIDIVRVVNEIAGSV